MNKTLTLKIINDQDVLDSLPKPKELSEAQKQLIKLLARIAVEEYIKEEKEKREVATHDRILRLPEVIQACGLKRASIYRYIKLGEFPKPINLGSRSVGWKESQITEWLNDRSAK